MDDLERPGALIGRAAELSALVGVLDRASEGTAGVALVGGDAGVGKTTLVSALAGAARERGALVLTGQCAELGESMPYLPLADALWSGSGDAELRAALEARPVLRRLLPDGEGSPDEGRAQLWQLQLFGAVLGLLGELGERRPVVLVLEDLHWADRSTRHLLTFLCRMLGRERACLLGTYRLDDLHRRHPLRPVVAELLRLPEVTGVELRPFGRGETAAYLTALAGDAGPPPADVVARVHQRSDGNPFYAAEIFTATGPGDELPAGLADLLLARVERLSADAAHVVRAASVAGHRVDDELVRRVSGLAESAVGEALREIVSHRLLTPDGQGYTFRHALLREAVYADLLPGERSRLHAAYADLLVQNGALAGEGGDRDAAELAHHSLAAHDVPVAFAASVRAGREAERVGAPEQAQDHYDRALSLWDRVPDPEDAAGTDRITLERLAVRTAGRSGDRMRAISRLRRLLAAADPADLRLGVSLREHLAHYLTELERDTEAIALVSEAIGMLPADPPTPERAAALATYSRLLLASADAPEMPGVALEAIEAARATGSAEAEAAALVTLGIYRETHEDETEVTALFAQARDLALESDEYLQVGLRAAFHHARSLFDRGDLAGAAASADESVRYALDRGLGWSQYGTTLRCLRYLVDYTAGDWEAARRQADGFPMQVGTLGEGQVSAYALFVEVAMGDPRAAERLPWLEALRREESWHEGGVTPLIAEGLAAEYHLWRGEPDAALPRVAGLLEHLDPYEAGVIRIACTALWAQADRAVRARAVGDTATAEDAAKGADAMLELARGAASTNPDGRPRVWLGLEGHAWLARAEAENGRAHGRDDPESWRRTLEAFDYGFTYEVARSRWRLAEALAGHGDRDGAAEQWRTAVQEARALGAAPLLAELEALGTRARLARPEQSAAEQPGGLTVREREVLALVARGRNNKEIAAELFISPKTASVHVSNIMAKLGASSRTEAAAVAHRDGLLG